MPLGTPKLRIGNRYYLAVFTVVHMKKATVNVNYFPVFDEDQVRLTGKILLMQSIAITQPMNQLSNNHLGNGISTPNSRHVVASLLGRQYVSHVFRVRLLRLALLSSNELYKRFQAQNMRQLLLSVS